MSLFVGVNQNTPHRLMCADKVVEHNYCPVNSQRCWGQSGGGVGCHHTSSRALLAMLTTQTDV